MPEMKAPDMPKFLLSEDCPSSHEIATVVHKKRQDFLQHCCQILEHSFAMSEALLDAKFNQRQIVVSWLDLKNAYGSVRHNLIQFALSWYHVPPLIRQLIFDYYDKICAQIRSKNWRTAFFQFQLGLFQGCVLSCILFDCVFQLLLDLTQRLENECGYNFKDTAIVLHAQAFADDISITTSTPEGNQRTINTVRFLVWYFLQANPKKCITFAAKQFDPRNMPRVEYERYGATIYCPYDPNLTINGEKLNFIVNTAADPSSLQFNHFKELGRWISVHLDEVQIKSEIRRKLQADMDLVENCGVNGLCKLFLFEHFVRLSWFFFVHDLNLCFAKELDKFVIPRLKRWAGLYRSSDVGALFRLRVHLGLQLTSIEFHFEHLQLVKCCLLQNSEDEKIRSIYALKADRVSTFTSRWAAPNELAKLQEVVEHDLRFAGQTGRAGLGSNKADPYIANPSVEHCGLRSLVPFTQSTSKSICSTQLVSFSKVSGRIGKT